jgi:hypothetical protein
MKISESRKDALWAATFLHYATERGGKYRCILGNDVLCSAAGLADEMLRLVERLPSNTTNEEVSA